MFEHVRLEGDFTLSSGRKSKYFYDFDLLTPVEHLTAAMKLARLCDELNPEAIVAPAIGGVVPGFLIAGEKQAKLVIVDPKLEGKGIRGPEIYDNYLIVDDVITSFETVDIVVELLGDKYVAKNHFPQPIGVASYVFRGSDKDLEQGMKKYKNVKFIERKEIEE